MKHDHQTELICDTWQTIKTASDDVTKAANRLENAERNLEAILYLHDCDLDAGTPYQPLIAGQPGKPEDE